VFMVVGLFYWSMMFAGDFYEFFIERRLERENKAVANRTRLENWYHEFVRNMFANNFADMSLAAGRRKWIALAVSLAGFTVGLVSWLW
jgi:hypothetical protein